MTEETKLYQLTCLLPPFLEQAKVEKISQKIKDRINEKGGSLAGNQTIFKKTLAYPLKKHQEAFYLNLNFLLDGQAINKINQQLNLEKNILRHFIAAKQQPKNKPEIDRKIAIAEEIKPLVAKEVPLAEGKEPRPVEEKQTADKQRKVKIEEIDQKLNEILNE